MVYIKLWVLVVYRFYSGAGPNVLGKDKYCDDFLCTFSEPQTFSFTFQTDSNLTKNKYVAKEDLHIYIVDSDNLKQSIKLLDNKMKKRTRKDKEFWFIDISDLHSTDNASSTMNMLDNLPLDVDDDIFLFMFIENDSARIWEMYKLAPEKELIVKDFGKWTREIGLKLPNMEKSHRRGDLSVSISIFRWK